MCVCVCVCVQGLFFGTTQLGRMAAVLCLVGAMLFVGFGTNNDSFTFRFEGLAGLLLGNETDVTHSVVSLGAFLPDSVRGNIRGNAGFGIGLIQAVLYLFVMFVPLLVLFLLLVLWIVPMSAKWQRRYYNACEVTYAWDTLDVFVVSLLACVLQIKQFAVFLIGDNCDAIEDLLAGFGAPDAPKLKCFDVATKLEPGSFMLIFGWLFSAVVAWVIMRVAHAVVYPADKGSSERRQKVGYTGTRGIRPQLHHDVTKSERCCAPHFVVRESGVDGSGDGVKADHMDQNYGGSGGNARRGIRPRSGQSSPRSSSPRTSRQSSPPSQKLLRKSSPSDEATSSERAPLTSATSN